MPKARGAVPKQPCVSRAVRPARLANNVLRVAESLGRRRRAAGDGRRREVDNLAVGGAGGARIPQTGEAASEDDVPVGRFRYRRDWSIKPCKWEICPTLGAHPRDCVCGIGPDEASTDVYRVGFLVAEKRVDLSGQAREWRDGRRIRVEEGDRRGLHALQACKVSTYYHARLRAIAPGEAAHALDRRVGADDGRKYPVGHACEQRLAAVCVEGPFILPLELEKRDTRKVAGNSDASEMGEVEIRWRYRLEGDGRSWGSCERCDREEERDRGEWRPARLAPPKG